MFSMGSDCSQNDSFLRPSAQYLHERPTGQLGQHYAFSRHKTLLRGGGPGRTVLRISGEQRWLPDCSTHFWREMLDGISTHCEVSAGKGGKLDGCRSKEHSSGMLDEANMLGKLAKCDINETYVNI